MPGIDLDDASFADSGNNSSLKVDSSRWLDSITSEHGQKRVIAQNIDASDKPQVNQKKVATWQPDEIILGIDVTGSMAEQPLAGMSRLSADCAGDKESAISSMNVDSRSKLEQLKDVLATFVSGLDDVNSCRGRIFGLSVDPQTHDAFFDSNKKNSEQTGVLFSEETLGRKQIVERIKKLKPEGPATAVANAINQCRIDAEKAGSQRPLLVLWTDGQENCGGNVCEEIEKFATEFKDGRIVVFGLDPTVKDQFDCIGLKALGNRFQYVDASDPNKSLEVLGKMSNQNAHVVNKDVHGNLVQEELKGNTLPYKQDKPDNDGFYGEVFGEIMRRKQK